MKRVMVVVWGTLLALSVTLGTSWAQDGPPPPPEGKPSPSVQADQPDPPTRIARLQYMSGSVSIQPQGTGDWVAGVINRPLTSSDNIWTDKDSRAELNVGSGLIRLNSESSLTLTGVSDNATQLELHQGTLSLTVRHLADGETYEIDTPNTAFTVQTPGEYRVDVDSNGNTSEVTVWKGEGQASTSEGAVSTIKAGEQENFGDNSANPEVAQAPAPDSFDNWCRGRDERDEHSASARYVSPNVVGSDDLGEYGTWQDSPDYGPLWVPSSVPDGWAPYHYGHWVWIDPWGWTWVDDEPWGFAPFHYGRWVYGSGYWGWSPGPYSYWGPGIYAPALVAWFGGAGWGTGFGFGFGGGIGWCALGWGEPFFPWYHTRWGYFDRINIYNTRFHDFNRFHNGFGRPGFGAGYRYANLRSPHGPIAVSQRTLTHSMPVRGMGVRMSQGQFARASLGGRVPVSPSRVSRLGVNAGRATAMAPSRSFSRPTVSRSGMAGGAHMASRTTASRGSFSSGSFARPNAGAAAAGRSYGAMNNSGRSVPRPPQNMSRGGGNESMAARGTGGASARSGGFGSRNNVPRPPQSMGRGMSQSGQASPGMRSSPSMTNRGYSRSGGSYAPRSGQSSGRGSNYVPRPSGPVRSSNYASNGYAGGYSSRSYSSPGYSSRGQYGSSRSYGGSSQYSSPSRGYSSQPSYRSYSAPSSRGYSSPSYRSYSAPSSRGYSGRSYSAPSYHGGSSYGGGRSYSGGGGGGHSGGGGHGGRR